MNTPRLLDMKLHAGDELLQHVARELGAILREGDTLARVGGDEFVLLLPDIGGCDDARIVAERVLRSLEPVAASDGARRVSASLGIAIFPDDGADAGALLQNADRAMYAAKRAGGNAFRMSAETGQERLDVAPRLGDASDLRRLAS